MIESELLTFLGRLHPVAVHFPIACVCLAVACEVLGVLDRKKSLIPFSRFLIYTGAVSGVVAALLGFSNVNTQQFFGEAETLANSHLLLSMISIGWILYAAYLLVKGYGYEGRSSFGVRGSLFMAFFLMLYGSHQGALLVHGSDYFTEIFEDRSSSMRASLSLPPTFSDAQLSTLPPPVARSVSYEADIAPIFDRSCNRCHGMGKKKGEFQLDTKKLLLEGGVSGPSVIPGNSRESYMIHLVSGLEPKNFMPEKGRELTAGEIGILRKWIDSGLPWEGSDELGDGEPIHTLALRVVRPPNCPECEEHENVIDKFLSSYFKKQKRKWPKEASSLEVVRRIYLDTVGYLPGIYQAAKGVEYVESGNHYLLINELLERHEDYTDAWLAYWNDLLRNDYTGPGFNRRSKKGKRKEITMWLRRALKTNMPYDKFVRNLVDPPIRAEGFVRGILWSGTVNPNERREMQAAQNIGQVFLGINLKCASCHDSFTSKWTLEDSYKLASVFAETPLEMFECDHPTGEMAHAGFLFDEVDTIQPTAPIKERKEQLAKSLTSDENGRFSRTVVNRIWAKLFGRGLSEPLDDYPDKGWHSDLHEWLAVQFVQSGYDIKSLLRLIMTSKAYRLRGVPAEGTEFNDEKYRFRGPLYRPMTAEQVLDTLHAHFGVTGMLSSDDLKRIAKLRKSKPFFVRLVANNDVQTYDVNVESTIGDIWVELTYPGRRKRNDKSVYEPLLEFDKVHFIPEDGEPVSVSYGDFVEYYRTDKEEERLVEEKGDRIVTAGTGQMHIRLPRKLARDGVFKGKLHFSLTQKTAPPVPVDFKVFPDLRIRASLLEQSDILKAFGRPKRIQVTTRRDELFSGPRVLGLATGLRWEELLGFIGRSIKSRGDSPERLLSQLTVFLGRPLTVEEKKFFLGELETNAADLLWALTSSPEFLVSS